MNYRILVIRNAGLPPEVSSTIERVKDWILKKTPMTPRVDFLDVNIPLRWKTFTHIVGKSYVGLDGVKELLEKRTDIVYGYYQAIVFIYDSTSFVATPGSILACWTYPNGYYGAPFIESFYDRPLDGSSLFYFICHELIHAMHRSLWRQGIWTVDDMDQYDGYTEPFGEGASYTRNLDRIAPYWKKVAEEPSWLTLTRMKQMLAILLGKTR